MFRRCAVNLSARCRRMSYSQMKAARSFVRRPHASARPFAIAAGLFPWFDISAIDHEGGEEVDKDSEAIKNAIKLGILSMRKGEMEKAEHLLHVALKMANDLRHYDGVTYIHSLLANLAFEKGEFIKCEKLYKDVIQRQLNKGVDEKDNSVIGISLKLAKVYDSWNETEKAVTGFRFCIDAQEDKLKNKNNEIDEDTLALWGMAHDWYGLFLLNRGKYREAFNEFQEAFITSCELFGDTHSQSLVLLNSLGTVSSLMGEDEKAVNYFNRAIRIGRSQSAEDLPTFLVNLGMAKIKLEKHAEANSACQEALAMAKLANVDEVVKEAGDCIKLANSYRK